MKKPVEKADDDVIGAREEKERKKKERGPTVKRKVALEPEAGKKKSKKMFLQMIRLLMRLPLTGLSQRPETTLRNL